MNIELHVKDEKLGIDRMYRKLNFDSSNIGAVAGELFRELEDDICIERLIVKILRTKAELRANLIEPKYLFLNPNIKRVIEEHYQSYISISNSRDDIFTFLGLEVKPAPEIAEFSIGV